MKISERKNENKTKKGELDNSIARVNGDGIEKSKIKKRL